MSLEEEFTNDIYDTYYQSVKLGYKPIRFLQMLNKYGALQTVKKILSSKVFIQDGIIKLWELNRLDLSVEAKIIKKEYVVLFSEEEIMEAKRRLKELNFNNF